MAIEITGLNTDSGLEFCDEDMDTYLRFLNLYISDMPEVLDKMRVVSQETLFDYAISAHSIKGNSRTIGAQEASKTAMQLEKKAKSGDLAGVLSQNDAFIESIENLITNIKNWLEKNKG